MKTMEMTIEGSRIAQQEAKRAASAAAAAKHGARQGEYLTFRLGSEEYGIDILRVQEIRSYEQPTRIANAPSFIKGVVNLRGVIVPIVDLRMKLGCDSAEYNTFTVVIVLNVKGRVVGAVDGAGSGVPAGARRARGARRRAGARAGDDEPPAAGGAAAGAAGERGGGRSRAARAGTRWRSSSAVFS